MRRHRIVAATALALTLLLVAAAGLIVHGPVFPPTNITAVFATATSIYPGDEVRVAGVKVGTISSIQPDGDRVKLTMRVGPRYLGVGRCEGRDCGTQPGRRPFRSADPALPLWSENLRWRRDPR